jgi:tRNA 2-thiouridine synthesizing protein A
MPHLSTFIPSVIVDLGGFHRRQPRALISWYLGHLKPGQELLLLLHPDADRETYSQLVRCCGGSVIAVCKHHGQRGLVVRRATLGTAPRELDLLGLRCPIPVIEARRRVQRMKAGEVLKLRTDCTSAPAEVRAWAAQSSLVHLLGQGHEGARGHVFLLGRR